MEKPVRIAVIVGLVKILSLINVDALANDFVGWLPDERLLQPQETEQEEKRSLQTMTAVHNWPAEGMNDGQLPILAGQISGISNDTNGNIVIFHRGSHIWLSDSFDEHDRYTKIAQGTIPENVLATLNHSTGEIIRQWGAGTFYLPHGLTIDHEDNIWLTDVAMHQVFKYSKTSPLDRPVLTLGEKFVPGSDVGHFCKPTDVAVDSHNGNFFVSDGYCNSRILKFDPNGKLLLVIDSNTAGIPPPSTFLVPHSLSLDTDNNRLFVADRENGRILVFNSDSGVYMDRYTGFGGRVFAVEYNKLNDTLYVVNGGHGSTVVQGYTFSVQTREIIETWKPEQGFSQPHDLASPAGGTDVYVSEIGPNRVWKFQKQ